MSVQRRHAPLVHGLYTVLGASGFVGRHLTHALEQLGAKVFAPARGDSSVFKRDLGCVFYCVGLTADYAQKPFETVEAHVSLLSRLLEQASLNRLIYLSSTRLYDSAQTAVEEQPLLLSSSNPRHIYDLSKALGENICLTASQGRAGVARLANVYSPAPGSPGFFSGLLNRLQEGKELMLDSSPYFSRDYVHIDDVVAALLALADSGRKEVVNVASGAAVTNREIADCLETHGWQVSFSRHDQPADTPACDITRLRSLGVEPIGTINFLNTYIAQLHGTGTH